MSIINRIFPFNAALPKKAKPEDVATSITNLSKALKVRVVGLDFNGTFNAYVQAPSRAQFEEAPYDFDRIIQAIDTDSYVKQGFNKYKELFWKEGWEIIGENQDAVNYLWQRLDLMEEIMKRPFNSFLQSVVDQLVKFGNVFIVEARADIKPDFPGKLYTPEGVDPICGYYIIPTETVRIYRNRFNKPIYYKQSLMTQQLYDDNAREPQWRADEVIHLFMDRKEGRAFGTPFVITALDDVISLRQIEEDILNLIHRDLFPLYKYTVGTEDKPSSPEEIDQAAAELANLRTEGGIIIPERHDVDVIGADGHALDAAPYLKEFKERVAVGMGLSPHHLGMMASGGNRSVTDRLDIALYDKVKILQAEFEDNMRLFVFNKLLREGGFNPMTSPSLDGPSDRCYMRFREIDIDTQVKKQTHEMQKFANNVAEIDETRMALGLKPEFDVSQLLMTMTAQVQTAAQVHVLQATAHLTPADPGSSTTTTKSGPTGTSKTVSKTPPTAPPKALPPAVKKPDGIAPSVGGNRNAPNNKGGANLIRPANQQGRRTSPNIRHMDDDILTELVNLIDKDVTE